MTAGTRRNGSSKLGPFWWSSAGNGVLDPQAREGLDVVESDGQHEYGYFDGDDSSDQADSGDYAGDAGDPGHAGDDAGHDRDAWHEDVLGHEGVLGREGDAGREQKPGRHPGRYTGRHATPRGKTARKLRVGKVIPAAAVAAAVAAGTTAYGLASSGSHAAPLNAAAISGTLDRTSHGAAGSTNAAGAGLVKVATASGASVADAAGKHAKQAVSPKPSASHTPTKAPSTPAAPKHAAAPAVTQAPAPAATQAASQPAATATTLSCNLNYGVLPENVTAIVSFLLANGYSDNAAAGIAGNIYQESKGDPESVGDGGGGLIGWTPLPDGFVTGDVSADLETQLNALLTFNQGWASYIPELNAAASPSDAAYIYVTDFERAGIPAAATREAAAEDVASACGI